MMTAIVPAKLHLRPLCESQHLCEKEIMIIKSENHIACKVLNKTDMLYANIFPKYISLLKINYCCKDRSNSFKEPESTGVNQLLTIFSGIGDSKIAVPLCMAFTITSYLSWTMLC